MKWRSFPHLMNLRHCTRNKDWKASGWLLSKSPYKCEDSEIAKKRKSEMCSYCKQLAIIHNRVAQLWLWSRLSQYIVQLARWTIYAIDWYDWSKCEYYEVMYKSNFWLCVFCHIKVIRNRKTPLPFKSIRDWLVVKNYKLKTLSLTIQSN